MKYNFYRRKEGGLVLLGKMLQRSDLRCLRQLPPEGDYYYKASFILHCLHFSPLFGGGRGNLVVRKCITGNEILRFLQGNLVFTFISSFQEGANPAGVDNWRMAEGKWKLSKFTNTCLYNRKEKIVSWKMF